MSAYSKFVRINRLLVLNELSKSSVESTGLILEYPFLISESLTTSVLISQEPRL